MGAVFFFFFLDFGFFPKKGDLTYVPLRDTDEVYELGMCLLLAMPTPNALKYS